MNTNDNPFWYTTSKKKREKLETLEDLDRKRKAKRNAYKRRRSRRKNKEE